MISADTVLNIIQENGLEAIKDVIPDIAYDLIEKKYIKNANKLPYLKEIIKNYTKKKQREEQYEIQNKYIKKSKK